MFKHSKFGKRFSVVVGIAVVSALATSVWSADAASASTPYWYGCHQSTSGFKYKDSSCSGSLVVGGTYEWLKLPASPQISLTMKGTTPFVLKWQTGGQKMQTTCATQASSGYSVWNGTPAAEQGAKFSAGNIELSGCITKKPSGVECKTTISPIGTTTESVVEVEGKSVMWLRSAYLSLFQINAEPCGLVQRPYGTGLMTPTINSATSSLEFTAANTKGLSVGGSAATLEGSSKLEGATEPLVTGALRISY